ncbi:uncharacterized protein LOC135817053 [Sycon ciliatum]|uniref:uncharacterized protein LOC135817053 n=1 Tax=Sycon ciliatum TaxID=27933 RepID=UPI0031F708C2
MAEPDSINAQAKTKRKVLQAHVKFLNQRSAEANTLLSGTPTPDEISSLITVFASTIKKGEELFDLFANVVYDFEATKKGDKEKKKYDEQYVDVVVELITECNDLLAQLRGKSAQCKTASPVEIIDLTKVMEANTKTQAETAKLLNQFVSEQGAANGTPVTVSSSTKLPVLKIPVFNGNVLQYPEFIDMFESTIHNNTKLSNVEKLVYLRNHLSDAALDTITGITLTGKNYAAALGLLKERFGKPQVIANMTYHKLVAIKPPVNTSVALHLSKHPAIAKLPLAEPLGTESTQAPIDILIGSDQYFEFVGLEHLKLGNGIVMLDTKLGFIPTGKADQHDSRPDIHAMCTSVESEVQHPDFDLQKFWKLEQIGIDEDNGVTDDTLAYDNFNANVEFINGRYVVSWPWKLDPETCLPENFDLAKGRLKSLMHRMEKTPEVLTKYHETILGQMEMGVIEEVNDSSSELRSDNNNGSHTDNNAESSVHHYIPHHCVVKPSSTTTKIRVVYDASAKTKEGNKSLNECIHRGPVLLPDLCGILLRFRLNPIAMSSDIEKAFLQVGLHVRDRNVTRFLWVRDPSKPPRGDNIVIYRFCRIPFGVIASPFLLGATIRHHISSSENTQSQAVENNTYVDNVLGGAESVEDAVEYYREVKGIFAHASMNLREWATNSESLKQQIPESDRAIAQLVKVLGMEWDTNLDVLGLTPNPAELKNVQTKRHMLSVLSSFYDPLGIYSPIVFRAKVLLQEIWKLKCNWDDVLPAAILTEWHEIAHDLSTASQTRIPRLASFTSNVEPRYELHVFCDASKAGYGAVAYLRTISTNVSVRLLFAKSRVAPLKETTIPRLELLAATLGARMINFLRKELPLQLTTYLWSDSQCVLGWVKGKGKDLPTFVAHRVAEISRNEDVQFCYVNTRSNPADQLSRGTTTATLLKSNLWWTGPEWLADVQWAPDTDSCQEEVLHAALSGEGPAEQQASNPPPAGIHIEKSSSFAKVIRVTAWVQRFIKSARKSRPTSPYLSVDELQTAEMLWLKHAQANDYPAELEAIKNNKKTKSDLMFKLGLFIDEEDGLIKCRGRMKNAELPSNAKFPILLCGKSALTRLIISDVHQRVLHAGASHTLVELRKRFWVTRGRKEVTNVVNQCKVCKRFEGGPFAMPKFAPLPKERVTRSAPFVRTGIDYFGPLTVKANGENKKVWVVLFTCLATRALHLELVLDMTTDSFLMAFKRFVARRGTPATIVSDNAKQFKLADVTMEQLWKSINTNANVFSTLATMGIEWRFIVQLSPWMGGVYERLVQSVKRMLRKSLGKRILKAEELCTLLTEVEGILNSRPLTYVGEDFNGFILTPAHFLCLNNTLTLPGEQLDTNDPDFCVNASGDLLLQKFNVCQQQLNRFWQLWQDEYLATLRERGDYQLRQGRIRATDEPAVDTVVIIREETLPRVSWPIGRIVKLHESSDGETRSATIQLPTGRTVRRSLCHLYPLECPSTPAQVSSEPEPVPATESASSSDTTSMTRPKRHAAARFQEQLGELIRDGAV